VSSTPRDLCDDQCVNQLLDSTNRYVEESERARNTWQQNRVNPLPQTKRQLKKARKIKRLQEAGEAERNKRLQEIRTKVIQNLSKE